ncbi:hypothetical protein [Nitrosomonas sp. Nm33]|uniref:hypothetical protein n=1 Tax=Nitrosomonas sp. Nm33 TaxID=133724 RepID=UPI00115FC968|nr:hypothetical protein [Nitrosomonas sp. Nm33]
MAIEIDEAKLQTVARVKVFLEGAHNIAFIIPQGGRIWIHRKGVEADWLCQIISVDKDLILRYLKRMTDLSRQQITRLVRQYGKSGRIIKKRNFSQELIFSPL